MWIMLKVVVACFRAFYTTIGQSYIPTTFSLENVFIYLFHKFFPLVVARLYKREVKK